MISHHKLGNNHRRETNRAYRRYRMTEKIKEHESTPQIVTQTWKFHIYLIPNAWRVVVH